MTKRNITEAMSFQNISNTFMIGKVKINGIVTEVNQLQDAIEDGTIDAMVVEAANTLHDGDLYRAYAEWSRVLSSTQTNLRKATTRTNITRDWTQYNLLREYVTKRMAELKGSNRTGVARANKKPFWAWTIEEIEAIPLDDLKTAKSVYDNMASKKAKYPEKIEDMGEYLRIFDVASAKLSACKKYAKQAKQAPAIEVNLGDSTMTKLSKGGKVTLSGAEAAELMELIKKLQK